jgi:hypothetical protein
VAKESELKASPSPPSACAFDEGWVGDARGDATPPKAFKFDPAGCCGGAAGLEAYKERMDCFRSDRPGAAELLAPVLEGLAGGADCVPPKKSKPRRLSPGLVDFGGAAGALGGAARTAGSVVLGRGGAGPVGSPNKSPSCGRTLACGGGGAVVAGALPFLMLFPRALCWTTFSGTSSSSPSSSSVAGSGIGPSMTHRLLSYFVRMKFSILASLGTWPSASLCSQYRFARLFPHFSMLAICSSVHESRSTLFTLLMCTPRDRWMPEHRMQTKTPKFQDAHRGCLLRLQSAHDLFDSSLTSCLSVARLRSAASAPGGGGRRDMLRMAEDGGEVRAMYALGAVLAHFKILRGRLDLVSYLELAAAPIECVQLQVVMWACSVDVTYFLSGEVTGGPGVGIRRQ